MRAFAELSAGGRTRRLGRLVRLHLRQRHGIEDVSVASRQPTFNRLFVATDPHGTRLAVRVSALERIHADGVEDVERRWLDQLVTDPSITAPQLITDDRGASCHRYTGPEWGGTRTVSVFTWIDGRRLRRPLGVARATEAGALLARLHEQAHHHADPTDAQLGVDAAGPITFAPTDAMERWTEGPTELLRTARDRTQRAIDALWADPPHPPHLLHGDFGPHNLLQTRGSLAVLDFQDLQRGFAVQDVAVTLADMHRWGTPAEAERALADGYRRVRPWPAADAELVAALAAARSLNLVNLALVLRRPGFDQRVNHHLDDLRRWINR